MRRSNRIKQRTNDVTITGNYAGHSAIPPTPPTTTMDKIKRFFAAMAISENNAEEADLGKRESTALEAREREIEDKELKASDYLPEPKCIKHIMRMNEEPRNKWKNAMRTELDAICDNHTFEPRDPLPGEQILPLKWVFKVKIKANGSIDKLKARLVCRGDLQKLPPDEDTWSPTASMRLLKFFIGDAARNQRQIKQADFIAAYLQAKVKQRIFVKISVDTGEACPKYANITGKPLKLKQGLYGLTTSGKCWADELFNYLLEQGFKQSQVDPCLLIKRQDKHKYLKLINYVDDMLFYGDSDETENEFFKNLKNRFNVNLLGNVHWYLGFRIRRLGLDYVIDQSRYALNISEKFSKCANIKPRSSPLPLDFTPTKEDMASTPEEKNEVNKLFGDLHYRSAIGALIYLSSGTRSDITFAVSKLAKFSNSPGKRHFQDLIWLIGYVQNSCDKGIRFYSKLKDSPVHQLLKENNIEENTSHLVTFSDASWQDDTDTGRSTCGRITFLQGGAVDHSTYVPVPVAMSSGEAEYLGAAGAAISAAHLRMLWYDFRCLGQRHYSVEAMEQEPPYLVMIDNEAAIAMAGSDKDTARTKRISRRYHFVRQGVSMKQLVLKWIGTKSQLADFLTKSGKFTDLWDTVFVKTNDN